MKPPRIETTELTTWHEVEVNVEPSIRNPAADKGAFELLASSQSQDATSKAADGDLGFHSREELAALLMDLRSRNLDTFLNDLKARAKVEVREAALEKISVESSTAAADSPAAP